MDGVCDNGETGDHVDCNPDGPPDSSKVCFSGIIRDLVADGLAPEFPRSKFLGHIIFSPYVQFYAPYEYYHTLDILRTVLPAR